LLLRFLQLLCFVLLLLRFVGATFLLCCCQHFLAAVHVSLAAFAVVRILLAAVRVSALLLSAFHLLLLLLPAFC